MNISAKTIYTVFFTLSLIIPLGTLSADKLAVAADGIDASASISTRASRAAFFLIFEQDGQLVDSLKNTAAEKSGGASSAAVKLLEQYRVNTLIAGDFGEKMLNALNERKIKHIIATGKVTDAITKQTK